MIKGIDKVCYTISVVHIKEGAESMDTTIILNLGQYITLCAVPVLTFILGKYIGGVDKCQSMKKR